MSKPPIHSLLLRPRDPLILRDARPFTNDPGGRAQTLEWPLPQTVAGAMRTYLAPLANPAGFDWRDHQSRIKARNILVHGPLPVARTSDDTDWTIYFPAPRDAFLYRNAEGQAARHAHRPEAADWQAGSPGTDQPSIHMRSLSMSQDDAKPEGGGPYWSHDTTVAWLTAARLTDWPTVLRHPQHAAWPADTLGSWLEETRTHVAIQASTQTAEPGRLFSTTALVFSDAPGVRPAGSNSEHPSPATAMLCRVNGLPGAWPPPPTLLPLGGERRLVALETAQAPAWPTAPPALTQALVGQTTLRLQLATPAIFAGGWRPDGFAPVSAGSNQAAWLEGSLPELESVGPRLRLVSAIVGRRLPISGWSLSHGPNGSVAPGGVAKRTRFAVPAGSVYFFELLGNRSLTEADVERLWLRSICGRKQDQRDGYGLVLPGLW